MVFFCTFLLLFHTSLETQTIFLRFLHFETTRQAVSKHLRILTECSSQGGNIIMPLADMFFGAYFGELTDKFGINWMLNCIEKK